MTSSSWLTRMARGGPGLLGRADSVRWQSDVSRGLADSDAGPIARRLFVAGEAEKAVLRAVVVLPAAVLDASARRRTAFLLRIVGLAPRQARVLTVAGLLPLIVVVAAAGPAVGLALFALIRDSAELGTLVGPQ